MSTRALIAFTIGSLVAGCAAPPPELDAQFTVREVPFTPDSGTIAVRCGRLIDGVSPEAYEHMLVVIRDGRIVSVDPEAGRRDAEPRVPVLDLSGYTCLPGLIDMHTHLTDRPQDTADLRVYFTRSLEETVQQSHENANATL
jgi:imidazolonepropionase-like amidohydrolase